MECVLCDTGIGEAPSTTLLCGHHLHTACMLTNFMVVARARHIVLDRDHFRCPSCQERVFGNLAVVQQEEEQQQQEGGLPPWPEDQDDARTTRSEEASEEINRLYDESKEFRQALRNYTKSIRGSGKIRREFTRLLNEKRRAIKVLTDPLFDQAKQIKQSKIEEILHSDIYKNYNKSKAATSRLFNSMAKKYNITFGKLWFLRRRRGLARITNHRYFYWSTRYMIHRRLRLRFRA